MFKTLSREKVGKCLETIQVSGMFESSAFKQMQGFRLQLKPLVRGIAESHGGPIFFFFGKFPTKSFYMLADFCYYCLTVNGGTQ
ncbi:hypothetical protein CMO92_01595 [Candidatus Woesearchaeota archaeon]|nr:hypothetical protein [Candidatus Woesearchaeota archaeon]